MHNKTLATMTSSSVSSADTFSYLEKAFVSAATRTLTSRLSSSVAFAPPSPPEKAR